MKKIILLLLVVGCAHHKNASEKEIDLYCQDLNVLYQRIDIISSNILNAKTTRTPEGGAYVRKLAQNCKNGICEVLNDKTPGVVKYEPKHPDANKNGYVTYPNVTLETEKADKIYWSRVFKTVVSNSPVPKSFFFKDPRAKTCFSRYSYLKAARDYSGYLGRDTNEEKL